MEKGLWEITAPSFLQYPNGMSGMTQEHEANCWKKKLWLLWSHTYKLCIQCVWHCLVIPNEAIHAVGASCGAQSRSKQILAYLHYKFYYLLLCHLIFPWVPKALPWLFPS